MLWYTSARIPKGERLELLRRTALSAREVGPRTYRVIASTSGIARDGMAIPTEAWQLSAYRANPVLLWAHRRDELPIGTAEVFPTADRLEAEITFAEPGLNEFADSVSRMWSAGLLRAVSVGGAVQSTSTEGDHIRVDQIELLDISVVPVGGDSEALAIGRALNLGDPILQKLFTDFPTSASAQSRARLELRGRALALARRYDA